MDDVLPGITITGPAAITSSFTTIIVGPGESAWPTSNGDILIELDLELDLDLARGASEAAAS